MTTPSTDSKWQRKWDLAHQGHDTVLLTRKHRSGATYRWCLTCRPRELYVDEAAVRRAVSGEWPPVRLNRAERIEAVAKLHPKLSGKKISQRLGVSDRTIWRDLAEWRRNPPAVRSS